MQTILPITPAGSTPINEILTVVSNNGEWTYYLSLWPIYTHVASDQTAFRLVCALLLRAGVCRQCELIRTFGVNRKRLNRAVHQLENRGLNSFWTKRKGRKGGHRLTPERLEQAQKLLDEGLSRSEVAEEVGVKKSTLSKAISSGRLHEKPKSKDATSSTQSQRTQLDAQAINEMGTGCTHAAKRVAAAFGLLNGVTPAFEHCLDVPNGGVLCALPALIENGLLCKIDQLGTFQGYYSPTQVLLVMAFMLMARLQTVEQLRDISPGEFGKLMGLDRIPEARCMRQKMADLASDAAAEHWAGAMAAFWMEQYPDTTGFLYVDGHVKVYGGKNELPRRYVSRQRLCLRGISFYWVNDSIGQPFFVVERQIDSGMLETLRTDIIPRLLKEVPNQPGEDELKANSQLHRFVLVFDREGASPAFFKEMWEDHRIACLTYRKNPIEDWPFDDFGTVKTRTVSGETVEMKLAEHDTLFGTERVPVKEVRKLSENGHQTAIVTTARTLDFTDIAVQMFARWCQENFFAYAMHHFGIDNLTIYGTEPFPDTKTVINPEWRAVDREKRRLKGLLDRKIVYLHNMDGQKRADPHHKDHNKWTIKKAETLVAIDRYKKDIEELNKKISDIDKHITWAELPEEQRFKKMKSSSRTLMNTTGMICYRAETAMATILMEEKISLSEARAILQALFTTTADLHPDFENNCLHIHLHTAADPRTNRWLASLFVQLNQTETIFPGTDLKMVYHSIANRATNPSNGDI